MKFATIAALLATTSALDTGFGPTFTIEAKAGDTQNKQTIKAEVPAGKYLILALGEAHDAAVDMLYFGGKGSNNCKDMKGKEGDLPTEDAGGARNLENCSATLSGSQYYFTTDRSLSTGDTTTDTKLECGKSYDFEYMGSDTTAEMQKQPPKHGGFKMVIAAAPGCAVTLSKIEETKTGAFSMGVTAATAMAASSFMLF